MSRAFSQQSRCRAFVIADKHYDIGNDLFALMLGKSMAYMCGYWLRATVLDAAQEAKFDLICRKLGLHAGMTVLDIGCGYVLPLHPETIQLINTALWGQSMRGGDGVCPEKERG